MKCDIVRHSERQMEIHVLPYLVVPPVEFSIIIARVIIIVLTEYVGYGDGKDKQRKNKLHFDNRKFDCRV